MRTLYWLVLSVLLQGHIHAQDAGVSLLVLGNAQDGGVPHAGCQRSCCLPYYENPGAAPMVVSLGVTDHTDGKTYLFDAGPDLSRQLQLLARHSGIALPSGIFITHAHIGHYSGLQFLGREALNAPGVPVYTMPRMHAFLEANGPWEQLVRLGNIVLSPMQEGREVALGKNLKVLPLMVPHRDEYSETVGYRITGPAKSVLYIPDIDKWERWSETLEEQVRQVDYAFIDATFYDAAEVGYRDISQIPHPLVSETMRRLAPLPDAERAKVFFIHMNHTNPLLDPESPASAQVEAAGYRIARQGQVFSL